MGIACVLLAAIGFSAKAIYAKLLYRHGLDATVALTLRMTLALPGFLALGAWAAWRSPAVSLSWTQRGQLAILGLLGYYLASWLDFWGLEFISAGLERLILFLYPTLVLLLAALSQRRPLRRAEIGALALSYSGIALVVAVDARFGELRPTLIGGLLVFGSAFSYALYLLWSGPLIQTLGALRFAAAATTVSTLFMLVQFVLGRGLVLPHMPADTYGLVAQMVLFSTLAPVLLLAEGIRRIGAPQAALLSTVGPVATLLLGQVFLEEPLTGLQLTGAALVIGGVMLAASR